MLDTELIRQIVLQAPTVGVLVYLLYRLDQRISALLEVICELAARDADDRMAARLDALNPRCKG